MDNLKQVEYGNVRVDDVLFVKTNQNKKGEFQVVTKIEQVGRGYREGPCLKVTLQNGDLHFGWATRFLQKRIDLEEKEE